MDWIVTKEKWFWKQLHYYSTNGVNIIWLNTYIRLEKDSFVQESMSSANLIIA